MITQIDSNKVEFNQQNMVQIIERYNVLVELYAMAVSCHSVLNELYEVGFNERSVLKEQNESLVIQLKKLTEISDTK